MPFRNEVPARAREIGLDPAYVYGLIRQESRFIMDARSRRRRLGPDADHAGHRALDGQEDRPATTRPTLITDRDTNMRLGTALPQAGARRLRRLAGDGRGRLQRRPGPAAQAGAKGPSLEPAVWAENIPFTETRDYVKKVLSNATYYAALLGGQRARR